MPHTEIVLQVDALDLPDRLGGPQLTAHILHGTVPHGRCHSLQHLAAARQIQLVSGIHRVRLTAAAVALVRTWTNGVFSLPAWDGWEVASA